MTGVNASDDFARTGAGVPFTAFGSNAMIPAKYTCEGDNVNPPLDIAGVPAQAKSMALIVDDPDAPNGTFVHWVSWNIPQTGHFKENNAPGKNGMNGAKKSGYMGPCPPSGKHHYHFKVYALDMMLNLPDDTDKAGLEKAMSGHIVASGELVGLYQKKG